MPLALLILTQALPMVAVDPGLPATCRVLQVDKRQGEPVFADEVSASECPTAKPLTVLRYDRQTRMTVARADLSAGSELGQAYLPARPAIVAGQTVRLTLIIGHASISREVTALQTAALSQRYFVRAANGDVFAVPASSPTSVASEDRR